jgi:tRNA nucleotidyltransferase (CCA-adding enzyme)
MYDAAIKLLEKIDSFGYEAYMIGGYPRDLYLKRTITDVDICTDATPMELHQIFSEIVKTSSEYGTTTVIFENVKFEITTFRKEFKYTDMRRPEKIEYVYTLKEDIKRRDFVINTLAIDKNGNQIDLLGAKNDLDNKIIRTVGDPKIRLKEDALRILRAIRFATTLNFELDNRLRIYIKKYGKLLRKLSKDRKKEELDMIFTSSNKAYGIKLLIDLNLINYLDMPKLKQIKITPTAIVTWSQLDVLDKYNFNTIERETIDKINEVKNKDILDKKTLYYYGLYICTLVAELKDINKKDLNQVYANLPIKSRLDIDIDPIEICQVLNKEAGPFLKLVISDLEHKILNDELKNEKEEIIKYLEKFK